MSTDLYVERLEQRDSRLGRHIVHDEASRAYALPTPVDTSTWCTKHVRIFDPKPNPKQVVGNCTMCAQAMLFNTEGNRRAGVVLGMDWATEGYRIETRIDNLPGAWEPDDTGSSGLWACKTSQKTGDGAEYNFLFGGVDQVVQTVLGGRTVAIGTRWYEGMFQPQGPDRIIEPTGALAGGHEYVARGYVEPLDAVVIRCWWGDGYRDVRIKREHLGELIADRGDAHVQTRILAP